MGLNNISGAWGEAVAASYLRRKHYKILARGYRCRYGEIDLIASSRDCLVFVEVKLRKNDRFATAMEHVDFNKQQRLKSTAMMYLSQTSVQLPARFDVIEVYAPQGAATLFPRIHHVEDAF